MAAPRILFVKLSSLGDVVHHLPAVTDLAQHRPEAGIGWAVEDAYVDLVRLHPAVAEAIPIGIRSLKRDLFSPAQWRALGVVRRRLASGDWDFVVDTQGLLKSALVAWAARGPRFGYDRSSVRERVAARFYDVSLPVPRRLHAVERNRALVGQVFGYRPEGRARYGLAPPAAPPEWAPAQPFVVLLHAASRKDKLWPEASWIDLARRLFNRGFAAVLPSGNAAEREAAGRIAAAAPGAVTAPPVGLGDIAALLAHAAAVVGVDTGLSHLGVALGRPTVGIYTATDPALTGLHGPASAVNLGGRRQVPSVEAVEQAFERALSGPA